MIAKTSLQGKSRATTKYDTKISLQEKSRVTTKYDNYGQNFFVRARVNRQTTDRRQTTTSR